MKNSRVSRRKEILKIRAEINAKKNPKENMAKINKAKSWFFRSVLFSLHMFEFLRIFFLYLKSNLTALWSEKMTGIISNF